ncbi:hypothetical protein Tco_0801069 [Tanacetum coccineum]|uniref:Uncharacterized protein n=1 Tax=Tanacetum coccineum TaxID=301880 RepID=A0ABQ4ZXU0_9ASTR
MMVQAQQEQDEAVNEEMGDSLERAATTATSLDAEQDSGNINKTQSKATPNELSSPGTSSGGGPRRQETMGHTIAQTRFENVSKFSNDLLLARGNTLRSGEDRLKLQELMELFKKLEKKEGSRTHKLKRLYKVGRSTRIVSSDEASLGDQEDASKQGRKIDDIDKDVEITLVDETQGRYGDDIMFDVINTAATTVSSASTIPVSAASINDVEITLAQALAELKSAKPTTTTSKDPRLKGLIEREKVEANIALKETWDDIQAKIEADQLLAERLQAREQEELTVKERAILFQQLLEKIRKHFAAKRAEEKRNRPLTKAQQSSIMCTYLKNMEGWKPRDLKNKSFDSIQKLFDKAMKRVNTFVDIDTELVKESSKKAKAKIAQESSSKRAGDELEQESIKKQKVDEDKETVELKSLIEVIPNEEEVAVDAIPLATKTLSIVD